MKNSINNNPSFTLKKTVARLAAIQAIYVKEISADQNLSQILLNLLSYYDTDPIVAEGTNEEDLKKIVPDQKHLTRLSDNVFPNIEEIDQKISANLTSDWNINKLDPVLRAIIRAGICELIYFEDIPQKVIINEYTTIARSFFGQEETGFINSILDKISKEVRI